MTFDKGKGKMWKCKCGESHEDDFDSCWNCGADRPVPASTREAAITPSVAAVAEREKGRDVESRQRSPSASAVARYRDAYLVARATTAIGSTVKAVAIALGMLVFIVAIVVGVRGDNGLTFALGGMLIGITVGLPIYLLGVLVSAHGEVLKATLDTAVHGSPFLKKEEMARLMSL